METKNTPLPEEQEIIATKRIKSDLDLSLGGAKMEKGKIVEVTGEQIEAARKEMETEKKATSPEVKNLEELKQKAIEAGASSEEIENFQNKLEQAAGGAEAYLAQKEKEYDEVNLRRIGLEKSMEPDGSFSEKADKRKGKDWVIAVGALVGGLGALVTAPVMGPEFAVAASVGLMGGAVAMLGAPIARIQNWLEKNKLKKELSQIKAEADKKRKIASQISVSQYEKKRKK